MTRAIPLCASARGIIRALQWSLNPRTTTRFTLGRSAGGAKHARRSTRSARPSGCRRAAAPFRATSARSVPASTITWDAVTDFAAARRMRRNICAASVRRKSCWAAITAGSRARCARRWNARPRHCTLSRRRRCATASAPSRCWANARRSSPASAPTPTSGAFTAERSNAAAPCCTLRTAA